MSTPSAYQKVVTQYDVTEAGVASIFYSVWDNTDDILPITLPAITGGTVALVGLNGIWIEDNWDYAGGTLNIGPTTIAGLPAGILDVVGDLCAVIINDRAWTAAERAGVVAWGKSRGAPGVFGLGPELVTNGDFATNDLTGWTPQVVGTGVSGYPQFAAGGVEVARDGTANQGRLYQSTVSEVDARYVLSCDFTLVSGTLTGNVFDLFKADSVDTYTNLQEFNAAPGAASFIFTATSTTTFIIPALPVMTGTGVGRYDNISLRKLELVP